MLRVALGALVLAIASATALAQFMPTDCSAVDDEKCEKVFLKVQTPERQKEIIQELKKQQDELNKMRSNTGVKSQGKSNPKQNEADPKVK